MWAFGLDWGFVWGLLFLGFFKCVMWELLKELPTFSTFYKYFRNKVARVWGCGRESVMLTSMGLAARPCSPSISLFPQKQEKLCLVGGFVKRLRRSTEKLGGLSAGDVQVMLKQRVTAVLSATKHLDPTSHNLHGHDSV